MNRRNIMGTSQRMKFFINHIDTLNDQISFLKEENSKLKEKLIIGDFDYPDDLSDCTDDFSIFDKSSGYFTWDINSMGFLIGFFFYGYYSVVKNRF